MWEIVKAAQPESIPKSGALLQQLPWPREKSFWDLCKMYVDYVSWKYGTPTIVFDGYEPSIKDATHIRRTGGCAGTIVILTGQTILCIKKENFF